jgi:molybdopterin molybdotransferase
MISYRGALRCIADCADLQEVRRVPLRQALGCICAVDVTGAQAVPAFDNSAMDGFAVRVADTLHASAAEPLNLRVVGGTLAGDTPAAPHRNLQLAGSAWEINTGAPVPQGYDSVIPLEQMEITSVDGRPAVIRIASPARAGEHIRRAGEDFRPGDTVIAAGERVVPQHIMALAALGIGELEIYETPVVSVLSTGRELVDDFRSPLLPGQIRNANGPYLMALLTQLRLAPHYAGVVPDEPEIFEDRLRELSQHSRIVVSTGAVSAGRHDFIADSLRRLGADILFHKVAIRPGKPILLARLVGGAFYLGLPGNPVSAAVGLRFFLYPLLCALTGMDLPREYPARLEAAVKKKPGLRFFQKARCWTDAEGQRRVRILDGQESFRIRPMLEMNCWAVLAEEQEYAPAGATVTIAGLYPEAGALQ